MENETETKLKNYLSDLKARRDELDREWKFCQDHKMYEEARWIANKRNILSSEYVEIHNKVLGVYF